jgi:hypothetical protein
VTTSPRSPGAASRSAPERTAIIPPRAPDPWYHRLVDTPRYLALTIAGVLIVGGAAVFGVTQLTSGGSSSNGAQSADTAGKGTGGGTGGTRRGAGAVRPASVTVAVLNGTTVPGLAATLSDEVGAAGFKVGTITNFSDQQLAESVVQYVPGHEREAAVVSRRLKIAQREPVNPSSQALAGDATVIVIAGGDKSP